MIVALSACSSHPQSIAPANLDVACAGEGSPVVILVPGLGDDRTVFDGLVTALAWENRVCAYSRAGLGESPAWPDDLPDPTAGTAADQLRATLEEREIPGPYVLLGWSYGGLVAQAFAARHRDALAGLIFEDTSTLAQFERDDVFDPADVAEGGAKVDMESTTDQLDGLSLGGVPVIFLTQGDPEQLIPEADHRWWTGLHDDLASLSDDSLHLIALDAGHAIHWDSEALVEKAVETVVDAVRSGEPLAACDDHVWGPYGGECRVE